MSGGNNPLNSAEHAGAIRRSQGVNRIIDKSNVSGTQESEGTLVGDAVLARTRHKLVQYGKSVTRGTTTGANNQRVDCRVHLDTLLLTNAFQQSTHSVRGEETERVVVGTGLNGGENFLRLRRCKNENEMLGWLLHNLQQGVEAGGGDHVGLVNNENPVAGFGGRIEGTVAQFTGIVHTTVGGRVQFGDVEVTGAAGGERQARRALAAGGAGGALGTVQGTGEDTRGGRFAGTARTGE